MIEKPKVDEVWYFKDTREYIKKELAQNGQYTPGNPVDEAKVECMLNRDIALIFLMYTDAFYNGTFHFYDIFMITKQLNKFRPDMYLTKSELIDSLNRCTKRKRLYNHEFDNLNNTKVLKWKYNENFNPDMLKTFPTAPPSEPNPFETDEFRKLQEQLKNQV